MAAAAGYTSAAAGTTTAAAGTTASSDYWQVKSGSWYCEIVDGGRCVTDGSGYYGSNERCEVIARRPLVINTTQYDVEGGGYDYLTVNGYQYKYSPPNGVAMRGGAALKWYSDGSGQGAGWKVCAEDAPAGITWAAVGTTWAAGASTAAAYATSNTARAATA